MAIQPSAAIHRKWASFKLGPFSLFVMLWISEMAFLLYLLCLMMPWLSYEVFFVLFIGTILGMYCLTSPLTLPNSKNIFFTVRCDFPPRKATNSLYTSHPFIIHFLCVVTNIVWMTCLPVCNIFDLFNDTKILT